MTNSDPALTVDAKHGNPRLVPGPLPPPIRELKRVDYVICTPSACTERRQCVPKMVWMS
jgi:hypothetical protein